VVDKYNWSNFLRAIQEYYKDDQVVEIKTNYLEFAIGEHPLLPFEGHKLLRFSSKISGQHRNNVMEYIRTVINIAEVLFGPRIKPWHEGSDMNRIYLWTEVNESIKSYNTVRNHPERIINILETYDILTLV